MVPARPQPGRSATKSRKRSQMPPVHSGGALDEIVDLVLPFMPAGLIGPTSADRIRSAVGAVPAELVARFGLECRLDSQTADANVLFCADSETGGMQMLAGRHPLVELPEALANAPGWAPVVRFCSRREPGFLLHRATRDVWVDLAQRNEPSFSFGLRLSGLPEATRRPLEVLVRALEIGFEALRGAPLPQPTLNSVRALVRRLPETARVDRAGLIAGLPDDARLWLSRLQADELVDLVEVVRDRVEARTLRAALDDVVQPHDGVRARIDVQEGVGRAIGLVCTVNPEGSPPQVAARWRPLLDRLVDAGLCTSDMREALLSCYGLVREDRTGHWPEHLTRLSDLFGDGTESFLQWRLHHIAIECDRGEPAHAAAHIVAAHGWSRRSEAAGPHARRSPR